MDDSDFDGLRNYLGQVPAVRGTVGHGHHEDRWWVKFHLDIEHPLAWRTVQELGHVLNYLSLDERLPASFKPVSPPPYMNGGPTDFLSWVIENEDDASFSPAVCHKWLEGRLPRPVTDTDAWEEE